jgi:hypothetical protein
LCFDKSKISENVCFRSMSLSMLKIFCPSMKDRVQLEERVDLSKANINEERYVILMQRKIFWTNKWMQEPRNNFCRL